MANVKLISKSNVDGFTMIQETADREGGKNVLFITDNINSKTYWESKNVKAELYQSIDDLVIRDIRMKHKDTKYIFLSSPKLINRYYNETVNVKRIKANELFTDFDSTVYILSTYHTSGSIVSNSKRLDNMLVRR